MPKHISDFVQLPLFDTVTINLTRNQQAIVDAIDGDLAKYKWYAAPAKYGFYARRRDFLLPGDRGKVVSMHRIILERMLDRSLDKDEFVDHENGNGLTNTRSNLRLANIYENNANTRLGRNNQSGYKGVSFHKDSQKWRAVIVVDYRQIHLGYFDTPQEAHAAYCEAAKHYFGEFARFE